MSTIFSYLTGAGEVVASGTVGGAATGALPGLIRFPDGFFQAHIRYIHACFFEFFPVIDANILKTWPTYRVVFPIYFIYIRRMCNAWFLLTSKFRFIKTCYTFSTIFSVATLTFATTSSLRGGASSTIYITKYVFID